MNNQTQNSGKEEMCGNNSKSFKITPMFFLVYLYVGFVVIQGH